MINVGFGSFVSIDEIVAIVPYAGARLQNEVIKRKRTEENGRSWLLDCTRKKSIKSVIICKNGLYIISNISTETLVNRFNEIKKRRTGI